MYSEHELLKIYNEISDDKLSYNDILPILSKINLILSKIKMDNVEIVILIDTLKEFEKYDKLSKITNESLDLIAKINGNNNEFYQEDALYFLRRLKHILLPSSLNRCENDYDLSIFLAEFDILISLIFNNCHSEELKILEKYNLDLKEIMDRYIKIINNYQESDLCKYSGTSDIIIVNTTISHLATMLYFGLIDYDFNYDLINNVTENIMNNYLDFMYYCYSEGIYQDILHMKFNSESILKEYIMCSDLLKKEFMPPVKILK